MSQFSVSQYGPQIRSILDADRLCELGPGSPVQAMQPKLSALDETGVAAPGTVLDSEMAKCCLAGLWLWYDFSDESHVISQDVRTATGSYWHGVMHRREPDFSNAKYWFRQVGDHPVFPPLHAAASQLVAAEDRSPDCEFLATQSSWDPFRFVDLCEAVIRRRATDEELVRKVARLEWQLLFDYCYRQAVGM